MSLHYKLRRAGRIIEGLDRDEKERLDRICRDIETAERCLLDDAARLMDGCIEGCRGLCCRNAAFDDIIGLPDLVYVLQGSGDLYAELEARLAGMAPFFTGDCPLLADGRGPCLLPATRRPEVCITTFCADTAPIGKDIARVRRAFMRLGWFLWWTTPLRLARRIGSGTQPRDGHHRRPRDSSLDAANKFAGKPQRYKKH